MNTSPWLMAGRLAAFNIGRLLMRRLSSGVSSICRSPRRVPICGASVRTSPTVPVTVTCVCPPDTLSCKSMPAVAPPASVTSFTCASAKPCLVAAIWYLPATRSEEQTAYQLAPLAGSPGHAELKADARGRTAGQRDVFHLRVGEALPGGRDLVPARHRQAGQRVVARGHRLAAQ